MEQLLTALVLGANGQDGSLITRRLVTSGRYRVVAIGRQPQPRYEFDRHRFRYLCVNLAADPAALTDVLRTIGPERVFHLAAVHGSATSAAYESVFADMLAVNVRSVHSVLEYARTSNMNTRLVYASSAKAFGSPLPPIINEHTPRRSACLYAVTKNASADLLEYYRVRHGIAASQAFLFNHDSERRPDGFFIPKLARCIRGAIAGDTAKTVFSTLHFHCDWGSADEYMGILVELADKFPGEDFVVATGKTVYARDLVQGIFRKHGLSWQDHVTEQPCEEGAFYEADITKLRSAGLAPTVTVDALIERLVAGESL
jgi:GDPmannose 4,6-dehydratase